MVGSGLLNASDFNQMRFNVYEVKAKTDLNNHFRLDKLFDSFAEYGDADRNKVTKYIFYMYDPKSPLIQYFTDISKRKAEASALAGFDHKKDEDRLKELYMLNEDKVANMVIEFLRYINIRVWTMIVSSEETFYEYSQALLDKVLNVNNDKDRLSAVQTKSKIMEDMDAIDARLVKYYRTLYGEGEVADAVRRKGTSPEDIALGNV